MILFLCMCSFLMKQNCFTTLPYVRQINWNFTEHFSYNVVSMSDIYNYDIDTIMFTIRLRYNKCFLFIVSTARNKH